MRNINNQLRRAARTRDEESLTSLLLHPKCDALARDAFGWTALMHAACRGHTSCSKLLLPVSDALAKNGAGGTALMCAACHGHLSCVVLLLPVSDALAKDSKGKTATDHALNNGYASLADLIESYTLAMTELATLCSSTAPATPRKATSLRV